MIYKIEDKEYNVKIVTEHYMTDNSPALSLYSNDEQGYYMPFLRISVRHAIRPAEGCIWVKDYSENEGMCKWLEENNIAEVTGVKLATGFVELIEMRLKGEIE
jgi:hypothetical protein